MQQFLGPGAETLIWLAGAVSLMLWGMRMTRTAVTRGYGAGLRALLLRLAPYPFLAALSGTAATALLQSSTATCLMVASFAGRRIMPVAAALAMMLGADVGTALVATVLSFDMSLAVPVFLVFGFALFGLSTRRTLRNLGRLAIGLGLLLLGLKLVLEHMMPLAESTLFLTVVGALTRDTMLAMLFGAVLTWAAHSSLAMVLLFAGALAAGAIDYDGALGLVLGANLGGPAVAVLATWHGGARARQVALGHALLKWLGCLAVLPVAGLLGNAILAEIGTESLALLLFHCAVNIGLAILFLPMTGPVARRLAVWFDDAATGVERQPASLLDPADLDDPGRALGNAARQTLRQGDELALMLDEAMLGMKRNDEACIAAAGARDDAVDSHFDSIKRYMMLLRRQPLDEAEMLRSTEIMLFTTNLEHLGDIIQRNLLATASRKAKRKLDFSADGQQEIETIYQRVKANLQLAMNVFLTGDVGLAQRLLEEKYAMNELERRATEKHFQRLEQGRTQSLATSALHLDVLRDLRRINSHLSSVAYPVLEAAGALSRLRQEGLRKGQEVARRAMPVGRVMLPRAR